MTFTFQLPWIPIFILCAVLFVVVIGMLLRWKGLLKTFLSLVILTGFFGFIAVKILSPVEITLNNDGIFSSAYGKTAVYWSDVDKAVVIANLSATGYNPAGRISGMSAGNLRAGWFNLENGGKAKLLMEVRNSAVVIERGDDVFLLAPASFESFASEVGRHISLERLNPAP